MFSGTCLHVARHPICSEDSPPLFYYCIICPVHSPLIPITFCFPQPFFHFTSFNPFTIPLFLPLPIFPPNPFPFVPLTNFLQALSYYDCSFIFPYSTFFNPNHILFSITLLQPLSHSTSYNFFPVFYIYFLQPISYCITLLFCLL